MKPKIKKLPNGLRMLLVPMKDQRTATVLVLVAAGSKYETKELNGISHFLEHMCFKGTTARPSTSVIASELDALGAEYNAFTAQEMTGYHAKVAAKHLPQALDLIADIYTDQLLKAEDVASEKGVIVGEIDMRNDMLPRRAGEIFTELLYGDQPAGWPIAGTKDLVRSFTREELLAYRKAHYVPQATTVVVSGKFDQKRVERIIKEKFGAIASGKKGAKKKVRDTQSAPALRIAYKECDQTHLMLGFRGYPLKHRYNTALNVMAAILGGGMSSRLFQKIRGEMGAGYYAHAGNDANTDHGMFVAAAGVEHSKTAAVIRAILEEFRRLREELVSDEELAKVKDMLTGRLALGLEGSDDLGEYYGSQEVLKGTFLTPEEVTKQVNAVTARELRALAKKLFTAEHMNLAMIGPWKDRAQFTKLLKL